MPTRVHKLRSKRRLPGGGRRRSNRRVYPRARNGTRNKKRTATIRRHVRGKGRNGVKRGGLKWQVDTVGDLLEGHKRVLVNQYGFKKDTSLDTVRKSSIMCDGVSSKVFLSRSLQHNNKQYKYANGKLTVEVDDDSLTARKRLEVTNLLEGRVMGTYNMSFASDLGIVPNKDIDIRQDSEAAFLIRTSVTDRREFWKNSLNLLMEFIEKQRPVYVGLVELNKWPELGTDGAAIFKEMYLGSKGFTDWNDWCESNQNGEQELKGIAAIKDRLQKHPQYTEYHGGVTGKFRSIPFGDFYAMCIWDHTVLGNIKYGETYDMNLVTGNYGDNSRPIIFVYTTLKVLLVVLHGPNNADDALAGSPMLKALISLKTKQFCNDKNLSASDIDYCVVSGDFNAKTVDFDTLPLLDDTLVVKKQKSECTSCCYNWDSVKGGKGENPAYKDEICAGKGERHELQHLGKIENYKFVGDFVFCNRDTTEQRTYRTKFYDDGLSRESDHELVYTSGISVVKDKPYTSNRYADIDVSRSSYTTHKPVAMQNNPLYGHK